MHQPFDISGWGVEAGGERALCVACAGVVNALRAHVIGGAQAVQVVGAQRVGLQRLPLRLL
jgi:hypothetical protein